MNLVNLTNAQCDKLNSSTVVPVLHESAVLRHNSPKLNAQKFSGPAQTNLIPASLIVHVSLNRSNDDDAVLHAHTISVSAEPTNNASRQRLTAASIGDMDDFQPILTSSQRQPRRE
jgi:hypothetical protein